MPHRSAILCLALVAACSDSGSEAPSAAMTGADPLVARALHDPLMSDPDLATRNAANALVAIADETALPLLPATPETARAAREAGRLELLEEGAIPPLPQPAAAVPDLPRPAAPAGELLAALGAPASCAAALTEDFAWAADLPPVASIMPHGMVVQAGGADAAPCKLRIVRYRTPARAADVLEYHHARAIRDRLTATYRGEAPAGILARGEGGAMLVVTVRDVPGGLTAVDLLYRAP